MTPPDQPVIDLEAPQPAALDKIYDLLKNQTTMQHSVLKKTEAALDTFNGRWQEMKDKLDATTTWYDEQMLHMADHQQKTTEQVDAQQDKIDKLEAANETNTEEIGNLKMQVENLTKQLSTGSNVFHVHNTMNIVIEGIGG